jgi:predicted Zn-dependent protease
LYFEQNRPEVAFEQYCVALEQAQQDLQVNYQLAIFLNSQNRLNEAVPCLERACAVQPQNADLHSYFADVYLRLGKPMLAQEVLESALNAGVAVNADVHADWAALYIALNNEKDAITELGAALEEEPGHCRASVELSSMFCKHNQLAEAVKILEQALNYHPNSLLLHRRLGEVYILGNVLDKAMDHFEQIV